MGVNIGPRIGIEGEKEYRRQVNELITQSKTFSAEMRELESSFDKNTSAMEKNRKKGELLNKQIANQEKTVAELEKGLAAAEEKFGENAVETNKWRQQVANAKTELNKLKKDLDKLPNSLQTVGQSVQKAGQKMQSIGGTLTKSVSLPLAAVGAASIKMAADAQTSFAKVSTIMDSTQVSYEQLTKGVIEASNQTGVSVTDFNEALYSTVSAGVDSGNAIKFTTDAVKLAKGGFTDTEKAVDVLTTVINAYGLSAEDATEVSDTLIATQNLGKTTVDELAGSLGRVIPTAKSVNVNFKELSTGMAILTKRGIGTNEATTYLNAMLGELGKSGSKVDKILRERTGHSFRELMDSGYSLTDVLEILDQAAQDDNKSLSDLFSQQNAGKAALTIMSDAGQEFNDVLSEMESSSGATQKAFETMSSTAQEKLQRALNEAKNIGIDLGSTLLEMAVPALEKVSGVVETAADWFGNLTEEQKETATEIAAAFVLGGPALSALGGVTEAVGAIITKFGEVPAVVETVSGVISAVGSPAGLVALGLGALTAVMIAARDEGINSNEALQEMLSNTTSATDELNEATGSLNKTINETSENIKSINAKASTAEDLVNELYDLEKQSNKTAAEQGRMYLIVDELNTMYPDLALSIDETTWSLNKGKTEVKGYIDEAKKLALIEAYSNESKETLEKLATASINLKKAQAAQAEGQAYVTQAQKDYLDAVSEAPEVMAGQNGVLDETTGKWHLVDQNVTNASNALKLAEGSMLELNQAVTDGEQAVTDAEEEYQLYTESAEELSQTITKGTDAQKEQTDAVEELSEAVDEGTDTIEENTDALNENVKVVADVAKKVVKSASDEIKAWDDLYKSTHDSIQGQLGLFDEWEQNTELTFADMQKNLTSQIEGMSNYATNMEKLSAAAVESADPNFKALVQALADMGIDAAGEVDTLVKTMETDRDAFNKYVADYGGNYQQAINNVAKVETYIGSGFKTKTMNAFGAIEKSASTVWKSIQKAAKSSADSSVKDTNKVATNAKTSGTQIQTSLTTGFESGFKTLPATAQTNTQTAVTNTTRDINGMKLEPKVNKIDVPEQTRSEARGLVTLSVTGIEGSVSKITGGAKAGKEAGETASASMKVSAPMKVTGAEAAGKSANTTAEKYAGPVNATMKVTDTATAARNAKTALENWFARNPITTKVKSIIETVRNKVTKHAEGGFTSTEQLSWLSEGDKPEVVIPLSSSKRSRALSLYEETGEILGVAPDLAETTTIMLPDGSKTTTSNDISVGFDAEKLYAAVAAGAEKGMENANVKIYVNNREAGRILKNMGVQFA